MEPCQKFKVQDFPVAVAPWQETKSSVFSENCEWSPQHLEKLMSSGASFEAKTLEVVVANTLNEYFDYQKDIAATLECCLDDDFAKTTKTNAPACISNKAIQSYCRGDGKGTSFKDYFKDINDRLKALRIAAYRNGSHPGGYENATNIKIQTDKPMILKAMNLVEPEIVSLGRIPPYLEPLSEEEVKLAQELLAANPKESNFTYKKFVSKRNPGNDYYALLAATPFLGEVSKRELTYNDFKNILIKFRERNNTPKSGFQETYYRDFMGVVADYIAKVKDSATQRMLCRHSEFKSNLAKLGVVVLKEIPLVVATAYGGVRGKATMPVGASIKEILMHLGLSVGKVAPAGLVVSGMVDLARSKQFDIYCGKKLSDSSMDDVAPLCNQVAVLQSLEQVQANVVAAAGFTATLSGGMAWFRAKKAKDLILRQAAEVEAKGVLPKVDAPEVPTLPAK